MQTHGAFLHCGRAVGIKVGRKCKLLGEGFGESWRPGAAVVSSVPGSRPFFCMFSTYPCGFPPGAPASSHSPRTCRIR